MLPEASFFPLPVIGVRPKYFSKGSVDSSHASSDVMHTAEYISRSTVGTEEDGGFLNNLAFGLKHL